MSIPTRLTKRNSRSTEAPASSTDPESARVQSWVWPLAFDRLTRVVPMCSLLGAFLGFQTMRSGTRDSNWEMVVCGLLVCLVCAVAVAVLGIGHFVLAKRVRLTRESLFIEQTLRDSLYLSYHHYGETWIADGIEGFGPIRFIVFSGSRGCTILDPPSWLRVALTEIARIQMEEGWYPSESPSPDISK